MLGKHMLGYIPANIVPALASFGAVFCYTRLLSPEAYGHYALALSMMTLMNAAFFTWLQTSLPRLMPEAVREGTALQLRTTAYAAFAGMAGLLVVVAGAVILFAPLGSLLDTVCLAVPLGLMRAFLNLNQAFHRTSLNFKRYNLIECGQALLGFAVGLTLVGVLHFGSEGAISGLIAGMIVMALVDAGQWLSLSQANLSRESLRRIIRFGLPLTLSFGLSFIIAASDRFLIQYFQGAGQVGIYAAGYTLMDRIGTIIFMMVALPSFPLTIHKLEHEGLEAARLQTYKNGVAMLALGMPACIGLMLINPQLGAVFIGEDFRAGALQVMPWVAGSALLNGMATHYFDHAFHLGKKPRLLFLSQGPTALLNLVMNIVLIPRYGYMGAAYATAASYALLVMLSALVGRKAFPMFFPWKPALQIAAATASMAIVLSILPFPRDIFGLAAKAVLGGLVYGAGILAMNVMESRARFLMIATKAAARFRRGGA